MPLPPGATQEKLPVFLRVLAIGGPGSGKSAFLLTWPKPFVMDPERGMANYQRVLAREGATMTPFVKEYGSYKEYQEDVHNMFVDGTFENFEAETGCKTIGIDSVSKLAAMLKQTYDETSEKASTRLANERDMFARDTTVADWGTIKTVIQNALTWLDSARCHKVYIAHAASRWVSVMGKNGKPQMQPGEGVVPKGGKDFLHNVDIILVFLAPDDPRNTKKMPGIAYVEKDRTQTFAVGSIAYNVSYQSFVPFLESGRELAPEVTTTFMGHDPDRDINAACEACFNNAVVRQYAAKIGLSDEGLRSGIASRNGDLNEVIAALKAKAGE